MTDPEPLVLCPLGVPELNVSAWDDFQEAPEGLLASHRAVVVLGDVPDLEAGPLLSASPLWRWLGEGEGRAAIVMLPALRSAAWAEFDQDLAEVEDALEPPIDPSHVFTERTMAFVARLTGGRAKPQADASSGKPPVHAENRAARRIGIAWSEGLRRLLSGCLFRREGPALPGDRFEIVERPHETSDAAGHLLVVRIGKGRLVVALADEDALSGAHLEQRSRFAPRPTSSRGRAMLTQVRKSALELVEGLPSQRKCDCGVPDCRIPDIAGWKFDRRQGKSFAGVLRVPTGGLHVEVELNGRIAAVVAILVERVGQEVQASQLLDEARTLASGNPWSGGEVGQLVYRAGAALREKAAVCWHWTDQCLVRVDGIVTLDPRKHVRSDPS